MTITLAVGAGGSTTTVVLPDPVVGGGTTGTVLDARNFAGGTHAGTLADPWPASAIVSALKALPQPAGGTVLVADGIWLCTTENKIIVNNYILKGNSLNAILRFTSPNTTVSSFWFQSGGNQNASITGLTIDGNNLATNNTSPIRISNPGNFKMTNNKFLGNPNGAIPVFFIEGGNDVLIDHNEVHAAPGHGGDMFQVQPLGPPSLNTRFTVTNNTLYDSALVVIGLNQITVRGNTLLNPSGGFIGLMVCGLTGAPSTNNVIDGNTVDATRYPGKANGAYLGGLPNDPGLESKLDGFKITNNIIKGTQAYIAAQSLADQNYTDGALKGNEKANVVITGNQLTSVWSGSRIDIRGGTPGGWVDTVTISGNTLTSASGPNKIIGDANTRNVTVNQPGVTIEGFTPTNVLLASSGEVLTAAPGNPLSVG